MLTLAERLVLETLLERERNNGGHAHTAWNDAARVGDVVQLRPGAEPHWETSLLLVAQVEDAGAVRGPLLRPHRSGLREAGYAFTAPVIIRVGSMPFPPPGREIRHQAYIPICPRCLGRV